MAKRVRLSGLWGEMGRRKTLFLLKAMGVSPFAEEGTGLVHIGVWDPKLSHEKVREAERAYLDSRWAYFADVVMHVAFRDWSNTDDIIRPRTSSA